MNKEEFVKEVEKIGIELDQDKLDKLDYFYNLLISWNEKINLTRITDINEVYLKHFYDSLTLIKAIDLNKNLSLCDVGTGAGFPGIVLKIVFPNLKITLIDSLNKRINYLNEIIKKLNLSEIEAIHSRSEDYARINYEKFDIVTARAVANLEVLSELCLPMVKENGYFIPMKANCDWEIQESLDIIKKLGGSIEEVIKFNLPCENSERTLIKIKKISKTNHKYPRRFDKIKKAIEK